MTVHPIDARHPEYADRVYRKVAWRLIPFLFLLYIIAYLDRVNVGFAALQMNGDLGFSATVYGFGAGVFFLGYALFEVPSNLILEKVGPRRWIARIMLTWGIISAAMAWVETPTAFYTLRFLLGVAEAGFFPGIIFYLTYWFGRDQRGRVIALFLTAAVVASVIGAPISGALLEMHGVAGLRGWQWLFLLEGAPAILLSVVTWRWLPDSPVHATWLTLGEREWITATLERERQAIEAVRRYTLREALTAPRIWLMALIYTTLVMGVYGVGMWMPQVLKGLAHYSDFTVGLLSAIPYLVAAVGMVIVGHHSDRHGERRKHLAVMLGIAMFGLLLSSQVSQPLVMLAALSLAAFGLWSAVAPFWAYTTDFLSGSAAAAGIALVNSVGNLGGFAGPYLVGKLKDLSGGYDLAFLFLSSLLLLGAVLSFTAIKEQQGAAGVRTLNGVEIGN